jgi:hypothetical protein
LARARYLEGIARPKQRRTDYEVAFVRSSGTAATATEMDWTYTLGGGADVAGVYWGSVAGPVLLQLGDTSMQPSFHVAAQVPIGG